MPGKQIACIYSKTSHQLANQLQTIEINSISSEGQLKCQNCRSSWMRNPLSCDSDRDRTLNPFTLLDIVVFWPQNVLPSLKGYNNHKIYSCLSVYVTIHHHLNTKLKWMIIYKYYQFPKFKLSSPDSAAVKSKI